MTDKMLKAALAYADKFNWAVFPLKPKGKEPLASHGCNSATTNVVMIQRWWDRWPDANVAIACGPSKLVVIDLDADKGGDESWEDLRRKHGFDDDTVISLTGGGGQHLVFAMPDGADVRNSAGKLGPGVDVRANGGYIVAPPSIHPTGRAYAWEVSAHPGDRKPAPLPEALVGLLTEEPQKKSLELPETIPQGQRNDTLFRLACAARRNGATEKEILAYIEAVNKRCDPPVAQAELERIAGSVGGYEPEAQHQVEVKKFIDGKTFIPPRLGRHILSQIPFVNLTKEKTTGQLYSYHGGVYLRDGAARVAELAGAILGDAYRDNRAEETTRYLEMATRADPKRANQHAGLINVKNGMLDWETGKLLSHDPDHLSTIQIPTAFDPGARCPSIEEFLLTTLPADCLEMTLEWLGYLLIPSTKQQKALMVVGPGGNGKSTFLDFIRVFLGERNASGIPLQELTEHRFKRAELEGKLVNMFADLDAAALERSSYLKMIVTGDEIDAERKYGHPFTFKPFSRLIFSANTMPASYDRSKAFYRRWLIVPFPNSFEGDDADRDMLNKITTPQELSGLLNLAIEYLRKLTTRGYFDEPATVVEAMSTYKQTSDPMVAFLEECCRASDDAKVGRAQLYKAYLAHCDESKARYTEPRAEFYRRLREIYPKMIEKRTRLETGANPVWAFMGGPAFLEE